MPENPGAKIKRKLTSILEIPKEIALNLPLTTIIGNEEINIENYKGIVEYTEEKIRINTTNGIMKIEGKNLRLKYITDENISVSGGITKVEYLT